MLGIFVRWLIFLHVLSAITFFVAHGTAAAMVFKIRTETDFTRIRAMLDLSGSTMMLMAISFLAMGITGIILPFLVHLWDKVWIWLSIILLLFAASLMTVLAEKQIKPLRRLVGLPYMIGGKQFPAEPPAPQKEVEAFLKKINPTQWVLSGYGIPVFILWLMYFKPF